ncbi:BUD13 homolog [Varroa jacobsoni]|uniref:BUD13 homolog n=1 Tax=Varroa destructor TaxID=109461 RepID=A0A7M7KV64_VARDE|nr:BUD13 homolog [Varroa destructor]XP_022671296.1 BUD13 homolog [Varroa destructor]XP_022701041.1 BUD13 homolog [Varroa jacobsoni]XP_022701043.1 BUD13 homolog [Varroa jacobsoni]
MATKMDYLKRYMEPEEPKKKIKTRKKVKLAKLPNLKIFDANVDMKDVRTGSNSEESENVGSLGEDAPQVAAVVDEQPPEMRSFSKTLREVPFIEKDSHQNASSSCRRDSRSPSYASPVRRRKRRDSSSDESPLRKTTERNYQSKCRDLNASALRKRRDSNDSPSRQQRDSDESPPRNRAKVGTDSDASPPRMDRWNTQKQKNEEGHEGRRQADSSPPRRRRKNDKRGDPERPEREITQAEVLDTPDVISLRNTKKQAAEAAKKEQAEKEARRKAVYEQWNSGVVQRKQREQLIEDAVHEASKPLARAADDADLDERLRCVVHADDPMLAFIRKKKQNNDGRPRYNGPDPPPNRFRIWPGYRWDGVDRSNGFEAKIIAVKNEKLAKEEHAYKWSTEDM